MARGDFVRVFERPSAWPRAFFTDRVQRYETPADLVSALQAATAPFAAVQTSDARGGGGHQRVDLGPAPLSWPRAAIT